MCKQNNLKVWKYLRQPDLILKCVCNTYPLDNSTWNSTSPDPWSVWSAYLRVGSTLSLFEILYFVVKSLAFWMASQSCWRTRLKGGCEYGGIPYHSINLFVWLSIQSKKNTKMFANFYLPCILSMKEFCTTDCWLSLACYCRVFSIGISLCIERHLILY